MIHSTNTSAIKATDLRLGNFVLAADEFEYDFVIALEPGVIHLSRRTEADDERNILGLSLSEKILSQLGFQQDNHGIWQHILYPLQLFMMKEDDLFAVSLFDASSPFCRPLCFAHELQNAAYALIGKEIFEEEIFHESKG